MKKWVQIDFVNLVILISILFGMILLWQLFVGNHRADIERDKYIIDHCKLVEQPKYSYEDGLKCKQ